MGMGVVGVIILQRDGPTHSLSHLKFYKLQVWPEIGDKEFSILHLTMYIVGLVDSELPMVKFR